MERIIGKYIVHDIPSTIACIVFERDTYNEVGSFQGLTSSRLDEETIDRLLLSDDDDDLDFDDDLD